MQSDFIKLLIVDPSKDARAEFVRLCREIVDLDVIGEAASGSAAIGAAEQLSPDVMLIDVSLPDMSGFEVLRRAADPPKALGIMTSHQPDHAEQAIAAGAVDYLRKPVDAERFAEAIERVRQRRLLESALDLLSMRQFSDLPGRPPKLLVGERQHRLYPLEVERIDYIEADRNYVTIRVGEVEYISRDSLKRLSTDLSDFGFVRIDRSILLNIRAVHFAEPVGHGTLAFTLFSGACLRSRRTYRGDILRILPWHHTRTPSRF